MKIQITKEWCINMAHKEGDLEVGAGLLALDPDISDAAIETSIVENGEDPRLAFGPFVQLMRRYRELSVEELANNADIDVSNVINIERYPHYIPEPRTVVRLSQFFRIPSKRLMQLSGNVNIRDERLRTEAVRFAAKSGSIERLTDAEREAIEVFVAILKDEI